MAWVLECGSRYWGGQQERILEFATTLTSCRCWEGSGRWLPVPLPAWADDLGVGGELLVDESCLVAGNEEPWQRCDWVAAAWLHVTGAHERAHEAAHGPIHSYAFRLAGADQRLFDYAWVNRIFLFLRRCAAREANASEEQIFGPLPDAEIVLTHDVDALRKTPEIRAKQGAFYAWNAGRAVLSQDWPRAKAMLKRGANFVTRSARFDTIAEVRALEDKAGLRSIFHVYGGPPGWRRASPVKILLDPAYDVETLRPELKALIDGGWTIGVHPSVATWRDPLALRRERMHVAAAAEAPVVCCRQHWLKFSWAETWCAQAAAGLRLDSTLGFNDRPGFRNGAALRFFPWNHSDGRPLALEAMPMVLMDSHVYDYAVLSDDERYEAMSRWIGEVRDVRGQATVNWHTHTITDAYGWGEGFRQLVRLIA